MVNAVFFRSALSAKVRNALMLLFFCAVFPANAAGPRLSAAGAPFTVTTDSAGGTVRMKALPQKALDVKAEFPGGMKKMRKFIHNWIKSYGFGNYTGEMDTVRVGFIIEANGTITGARILRHGTYAQDCAVLEAVSEMPDWQPGMKEGKPVRSRYVMRLQVPSLTKRGLQVQPSFPGGAEAYADYMVDALRSSPAGGYTGLPIKVWAEFIVEADGSITGVRIVKHGTAKMDEAVIRVLSDMPKWTPGTLDGKPVRMKQHQAVTFGSRATDHGRYTKLTPF